MTRGFTFVELCTVLLLLGIGLAALIPAARRQRDHMAVLAAREAAVGLVGRTRREARLHGGAALHVRREGALMWIDSADPARDTLDLESRFGVHLDLSSAEVRLPFDPVGIGRLASRSFAFTRGRARAGFAVSAYGRVRRW